MSSIPITPKDDHFVSNPDLDFLGHRPHKAAALLYNAMTATALFTIWPHLLFFGGWSAMVCCVNRFTAAELVVPSTLLTALGVLLGLTLSYRTSSAYERYWEGRKMWSQIILTSRNWARLVWIHCPDSLSATPPNAGEERELDRCKAEIEKATVVRMALAFAVSVKHYLRGEEGILYEDLYDLVRFIPSLNLPCGIPSAMDANNASGPPHLYHRRCNGAQANAAVDSQESFGDKMLQPTPPQSSHASRQSRPILQPARSPPVFRWSECFSISFLVTRRQRLKAEGRKARKQRIKADRQGGGVGANVPLEVTMFMSSWLSTMQRRKTIDVPTTNALLLSLQQMGEALSALERILTTPIPWSYNAHIWAVTLIYCLLLPFQLYGSGFGWLTIPAVVITSYIVIGFAAIGAEIENPFGYDKNDLNLDFFTSSIISQELAAITARPFPSPDEWVFSPDNQILGIHGVGADSVLKEGMATLRLGLKHLGKGGTTMGRSRANSTVA